jgi:putative flippase GtrA
MIEDKTRMSVAGRAQIAREGIRYLWAGAIASAVNWFTRWFASYAVSFEIALVIGASLGMLVGFLLYRSWVFPNSSRPLHFQTTTFLVVNGVTAIFVFFVSVLIAYLLKGLPGSVKTQEGLAHAVGIAFGAPVNFLGHRMFTFSRRQKIRP